MQQMLYIGNTSKGKTPQSTHLTLLKHQNTKTSLYKLSKNHWAITLLEKFWSVRRNLQSTVSLDHPVSDWQCCHISQIHQRVTQMLHLLVPGWAMKISGSFDWFLYITLDMDIFALAG